MKDIIINSNRCEITYEQLSKFYLPEDGIEFLTNQISKYVDFRIMCQILDGRINLNSKHRKLVKDYLYKIMVRNSITYNKGEENL